MQQQESNSNFRDPAIKLFGKNIPLVHEQELQADNQLQVSLAIEDVSGSVKPKTVASIKEKEEEEEQDNSQQVLKKPDKILPCPRCNSMDTKFCYYNNYNVNQPRHFCKACQRYWTAGGTMRNVAVGAGRRKNKNSYRHITISEALQAAQIKIPNTTPISCDHSLHLQTADDCSSTSTISSNLVDSTPAISGFQINPCLSGWPFPWNPAVSAPPMGMGMAFYPAAYWNSSVPGALNLPWLSSHTSTSSSGPDYPTLGKHSRDDDSEKQQSPSSGRVLVPKTLRIDDPNEAAKSSIWATLGIKNESLGSGGMFKAFQPKSQEKNRIAEASDVLRANPAALSRSINFHENS